MNTAGMRPGQHWGGNGWVSRGSFRDENGEGALPAEDQCVWCRIVGKHGSLSGAAGQGVLKIWKTRWLKVRRIDHNSSLIFSPVILTSTLKNQKSKHEYTRMAWNKYEILGTRWAFNQFFHIDQLQVWLTCKSCNFNFWPMYSFIFWHSFVNSHLCYSLSVFTYSDATIY